MMVRIIMMTILTVVFVLDPWAMARDVGGLWGICTNAAQRAVALHTTLHGPLVILTLLHSSQSTSGNAPSTRAAQLYTAWRCNKAVVCTAWQCTQLVLLTLLNSTALCVFDWFVLHCILVQHFKADNCTDAQHYTIALSVHSLNHWNKNFKTSASIDIQRMEKKRENMLCNGSFSVSSSYFAKWKSSGIDCKEGVGS